MGFLENKQKDKEKEKKWKQLVEKVKLRRAGGPNPDSTKGSQGARHPFKKHTTRSTQQGGQPVRTPGNNNILGAGDFPNLEQGVSMNKIAMPNHPESAVKREITYWIGIVPEPFKKRKGHDKMQQFLLAPMGVLAHGSAHTRPSAQPPIDMSGNLLAQVSAE